MTGFIQIALVHLAHETLYAMVSEPSRLSRALLALFCHVILLKMSVDIEHICPVFTCFHTFFL